MIPGTKLGHYEVVSALGKGGMGEVWRARDSKLGREVAIKTLPEEFSRDSDRLARFEREAKLLASLNHPNIAAIYGLEEHNSTRLLVLELVEGETLADRLTRGAIPVKESLDLALQIAEALEAAHEKGVLHRDLKPANIKITPEGKVKVLDFGLAKAFAGNESDPTLSNSPTLSMAATQQGVILGTAAYMAPEQARGKNVDKRADIWAFGVVLYEMVTGKRLFQGEDLTDTLASVVKIEPDLSAAPAELRGALAACLQKDPRKRLRDIGDVWRLMEPGRAPSPPQVGNLPYKWLWPGIAAAAVIVAAIAGWVAWTAAPAEDRPLVRLTVDLGREVDLGAPGPGVTISSDGTRLAYVASVAGGPRQLYTRRLDQTAATPLPGTEDATYPFFSPDGEWIGFFQQGAIKKISVQGGAAVPLGNVRSFAGASWAEDGTIIFSSQLEGGLMKISEAGGESEVLAPLAQGQGAYDAPQILPGGRAVLFTSRALGAGQRDIEVITLANGQRKTLVPGASAGAYLPTGGSDGGHLVYVSSGTLFAILFDPERLETSGVAIPVLDGVGSNAVGVAAIGFSRNGTFVYRSGGGTAAINMNTVQWLNASGNREPLIVTPGGYAMPRLSPDSRQLALVLREGSGQRVSVYDLERGGFSPLTFDVGLPAAPVWSPDGRFVVFTDSLGLWWARSDSAGRPQPFLDRNAARQASSVAPDGSRLAYIEFGNQLDLWTVPLTTEGAQLKAGEPEKFLATPFTETFPMFSRDGHWLAYQSNESGRPEIYVRAFPPPESGEGARFSVSTDGGIFPVWSRNTDELYFRSPGKIMVARYRVNGENFVADRPRVWADLKGATFWDMAADGRALITVPVETDNADAAAPEIQHNVEFLENFFDELRRRAPAN